MPKRGTATLERDVSELRAEIRRERDAAAKADADANKLRDEEKDKGFKITDTSDDARETFARIDAAYKVGSTHRETAATLEERLHTLLEQNGHEARGVSGGDPSHPAMRLQRTLGAIAAGTDVYQQIAGSGSLRMHQPEVELGQVANRRDTRSVLSMRYGDVRADAGDGSPLVPSDETDLTPPVMIPKRQATVLDLITIGTTARDGVTYSRMVGRSTAAAMTKAYGSAFEKSRYTFETVPVPVLRKGHYAIVDEGNITDQEEFEDIVNDELITDLRIRVEDDILNAAGDTTTEWEGILQNALIGSVDADDSAFDNKADALHHAMTTVRVALEMDPTAWGIDPEGFEQFWLEKDDFGRYLHNRGPFETQVKTIWGLPAVVSTGFVKPLVGHWQRGAKLWVREGITIAVSNNVDDYFLEDLWAIKARIRAGFAVKQPLAFCAVENMES